MNRAMLDALPVTLDVSPAQEERARELHTSAVVVDCSSLIKEDDSHFERAALGGVTATNNTVTYPYTSFTEAVTDLARCTKWIRENSQKAMLATSVEDIRSAKESGRKAIIFGPQDTEFIGADLSALDVAYTLGVRILQLTYQRQNWIGSGCGETSDDGLSRFGRDFVRYMNDLGIVVDLSHCGPRTSSEGIEASSTPAIFSHAHPYSMTPHPRAKSDDVIRSMADSGGVIGITGLSSFMVSHEAPSERPTLSDFVRHVEYVADLVGIDHVGIGMDINETNTPEQFATFRSNHPELMAGFTFEERRLQDLTHASQILNVTRALVVAGFTDEEIEKVLGENFLRVFGAVWA